MHLEDDSLPRSYKNGAVLSTTIWVFEEAFQADTRGVSGVQLELERDHTGDTVDEQNDRRNA